MKKTKKVAITSVFASLSIVLYYIRFPLPFLPSFLEIQFSMLPLIIISFAYGLKTSLLCLFVKTLFSAVLSFANTFAVGELADLIIGISVLVVTTLVYNKNKTKKGGLVALILGSVTWVIVACLANYFILLPAYISLFFKGDESILINMLNMLPVEVTNENYKISYIIYGALPFNLIISTVVSFITLIVYKKVSNIIKEH